MNSSTPLVSNTYMEVYILQKRSEVFYDKTPSAFCNQHILRNLAFIISLMSFTDECFQ